MTLFTNTQHSGPNFITQYPRCCFLPVALEAENKVKPEEWSKMFSYLDTENFEKNLEMVFFGVALLYQEMIKESVRKRKLEPLFPFPSTPDFGG